MTIPKMLHVIKQQAIYKANMNKRFKKIDPIPVLKPKIAISDLKKSCVKFDEYTKMRLDDK